MPTPQVQHDLNQQLAQQFDEQGRRVAKNLGFDPERFVALPVSMLTPEERERAQISQVDDGEEIGVIEAFKTGVGQGVGPALGGVAGMGLGFMAGGPFGAIPGAIAGVAGALGGGFAGGAIQQRVEGAIFSPEQQQELAEHRSLVREERPVASLLGELAPAGPFVRPSPTMARELVSGVRNLTTAAALSPAQKTAVGVGAAGAGLGGGIEGAIQVAEGEFRPGRLAAAALIDAFFNEPTKLGRAIGIPSTFAETQAQQDTVTRLLPPGDDRRARAREQQQAAMDPQAPFRPATPMGGQAAQAASQPRPQQPSPLQQDIERQAQQIRNEIYPQSPTFVETRPRATAPDFESATPEHAVFAAQLGHPEGQAALQSQLSQQQRQLPPHEQDLRSQQQAQQPPLVPGESERPGLPERLLSLPPPPSVLRDIRRKVPLALLPPAKDAEITPAPQQAAVRNVGVPPESAETTSQITAPFEAVKHSTPPNIFGDIEPIRSNERVIDFEVIRDGQVFSIRQIVGDDQGRKRPGMVLRSGFRSEVDAITEREMLYSAFPELRQSQDPLTAELFSAHQTQVVNQPTPQETPAFMGGGPQQRALRFQAATEYLSGLPKERLARVAKNVNLPVRRDDTENQLRTRILEYLFPDAKSTLGPVITSRIPRAQEAPRETPQPIGQQAEEGPATREGPLPAQEEGPLRQSAADEPEAELATPRTDFTVEDIDPQFNVVWENITQIPRTTLMLMSERLGVPINRDDPLETLQKKFLSSVYPEGIITPQQSASRQEAVTQQPTPAESRNLRELSKDEIFSRVRSASNVAGLSQWLKDQSLAMVKEVARDLNITFREKTPKPTLIKKIEGLGERQILQRISNIAGDAGPSPQRTQQRMQQARDLARRLRSANTGQLRQMAKEQSVPFNRDDDVDILADRLVHAQFPEIWADPGPVANPAIRPQRSPQETPAQTGAPETVRNLREQGATDPILREWDNLLKLINQKSRRSQNRQIPVTVRDIRKEGEKLFRPYQDADGNTVSAKAQFDEAILQLGRADAISLRPHDSPGTLSGKDRREIVTGPDGAAYNLISPRVESLFQRDSSSPRSISDEALHSGQQLANARGVRLIEQSNLVDSAGNPIRGKALVGDLRKRIAKYDPERAADDTLVHEIAHFYVRDLMRSPREQDRRLIKKGLEIFGGDEEAMVAAIGLRARDLQLAKGLNFKAAINWIRDVLARLKQWFGSASDDDIIKTLSRRLIDDAPYESPLSLKGDPARQVTELYHSTGLTETPIDRSDSWIDRITWFLKSEVDKSGRGHGASGEVARDALNKFTEFVARGRWMFHTQPLRIMNQLLQDPELGTMSRMMRGASVLMPSVQHKLFRFSRYAWEMRHQGKSTVKLNEHEAAVMRNARQWLQHVHAVQKDLGIKVRDSSGEWRDPIDMADYWPDTISREVMQTMREEPGNAKGLARKDELRKFLKNFHNITDERKVDEIWNTHIGNVRKTTPREGTPEFGAVREAMGYGVPFEWIEKNPIQSLVTYGNRVNRDFSFFRAIQNDPVARGVLDVEDQFGSKKNNAKELPNGESIQVVRDTPTTLMMQRLRGDTDNVTPETARRFDRLVRSAFLGTGTAVRDHLSGWVHSLPYVEARDVPKMLQAYKVVLFDGAWDRAAKKGVVMENILDIELGHADYTMSRAATVVDAMADTLRSIQGRQFMENFTRAHNFALGELVSRAALQRAYRGGKSREEAMKFFKRFANREELQEVERAMNTRQLLRDDVVENIAARFTERVQGTYDDRGLPLFVKQGWMSPFFNLARWGIERVNIVRDDVVKPAFFPEPGQKRDMWPLVRYTVAGVLGGEVTRQAFEALNAKAEQAPSFQESWRAGSVENATIATVNLLQLGGYGGIVSDLARGLLGYKQGLMPRTFSYPLASFISENLLENTGNAMEAIDAGQDVTEVMLNWSNEVVRSSVQAYRMFHNHFVDPERTARSERFRDMRVFQILRDAPTPRFGRVRPNPLLNQDIRKFKETTDINEAMQLLESSILPKLQQQFGNRPEELASRLQGLKQMPITHIPPQSTRPAQRQEFLNFIEQNKGSDFKMHLLQEEFQQRAVNSVKQRLVPSF